MNEADNLDRAAELTQRLNDAALEEVQLRAKPEQVQRADGTWPFTECAEEDCGEPLPVERIKLGRICCITCQSRRERLR